MKPTITVLVSNDIEHDQRVDKVCSTLRVMGFQIVRVGRLLPSSKPFACEDQIVRFKLPFHRGALFYAFLQIRLLFFLISHKTDVILANDLDTLLPAWLVSRAKKKILVYDSHEYFTEAEGLVGRSFQKNIWLWIERLIFPRLKYVFTVNESIAGIYRRKYGVEVNVVRNMPRMRKNDPVAIRQDLSLPDDKKIIVLQGAYLDPGRGGIEAIEAMQYLEGCLLLVIGSGKDLPQMKMRCTALKLENKIRFLPRMPYHQMLAYTRCADLGLSLDRPVALNYHYSLPNKIFDYIHSGIPVVASDLPEIKKILNEYSVGWLIEEISAQTIAHAIQKALDSAEYEQKKINTRRASQALNWETEERTLIRVYDSVLAAIRK